MLGQFVGRTVAVVGKVVSHQEGAAEAQLQTSVRNITEYSSTAVPQGYSRGQKKQKSRDWGI